MSTTCKAGAAYISVAGAGFANHNGEDIALVAHLVEVPKRQSHPPAPIRAELCRSACYPILVKLCSHSLSHAERITHILHHEWPTMSIVDSAVTRCQA